MTPFDILIGLKIKTILLDSKKEWLAIFDNLGKDHYFATESSDDARVWIASITGLANLKDGTVQGVDTISIDGVVKVPEICSYYTLITEKGTCDIGLRTTSDLFYGGTILYVPDGARKFVLNSKEDQTFQFAPIIADFVE